MSLSSGKSRWIRGASFVGAFTTLFTCVVIISSLVSQAPPAGASTPALVYVTEPFTGATPIVPSDWNVPSVTSGTPPTNHACLTASSNTSQTPIPACSSTAIDSSGSGTLRFTSATGAEDGGIAYTTAIPSSEGIDVSFTTYQYGGDGADGILFFLAGTNPTDPSPPAVLGPDGGDLGYSADSTTASGLDDGYLGIGYDVFGNYVNPAYEGTGCTNPSWNTAADADQVSVRGPGNGTAGYCMLSSTEAEGGLTGNLGTSSTSTREESAVPTEVAINPTASPTTTQTGLSVPAYSYVVSVTPIDGPTQQVTGSLPNAAQYLPSSWLNPSTGIPDQLSFGWTASTGGSDDIHELSDVEFAPLFTQAPRLGLSLTDNAAGVLTKGSTVTYTAVASVGSNGGDESVAPTFTDTFPSGVVPESASGSNWDCSIVGQAVSCSLDAGALPVTAGTSMAPITISTSISSGASGTLDDPGEIYEDGSLVASATDDGAAASSNSSSAVLGLSLTDSSAAAISQGTDITYLASSEISSDGASETVAPDFTDTFPTGYTPGSATASAWSCNTSGQTVSCSYTGSLPIAAGTALGQIQIPVTVGEFVTGAASDSATLSSTNAAPLSVTATDAGEVVSVPRYGLTLSDGHSGDLTSGSNYTYSAVATVLSGFGNEADVPKFIDTFPADLTPSAPSGTDWSCGTIAGNTVSCTYTGGDVTAGTTLPTLDITVAVTHGLSAGTGLDDGASVSSDDAVTGESTDYAAAGQAPPPLFSITDSGPTQAYAGTSYSSDISVGATIEAPGHNPVVVDTLPTGEKFASSQPTQTNWSCVISGSNLIDTCTYSGALPGSVPATLTTIPFTVNVNTGVTGSLSSTATVTDTTDKAEEQATSRTVEVTAAPSLSVTNTAVSVASQGSGYVDNVGSSILSTGGPADSDPVVVVALPAGETWASSPVATNWSCVLSDGTGTNSIDTCTYSGSLPILQGTTLQSIGGTVDVSATAATGDAVTDASLSDPTDGATQATHTTTVDITTSPVLAITATGPAAASQGGDYLLQIDSSLGSSGGQANNEPTILADLPAGETFASDPTATGWSCALSDGTGTDSILTCSSTLTLPIAAPATLTRINTTVDVSGSASTGDAVTDTSLSDAADGASQATSDPSLDITQTPVLSVSGSAPTGGSRNSSYVEQISSSVSGSGGQANNEPTLVADLPTGETWASDPSATGWGCSLSNGTGIDSVATCISTLSTPISSPTSLAAIDGTVDISSSAPLGDAVTDITLSDAADGATQASSSSTVDLTPTPDLSVSSVAPADASVSGTYVDDVSSSLGSSGEAYSDPVLTMTLPAGETWASDPSASGWNCALSNGTGTDSISTCSSTLSTPIAASTTLTTIDGTVDVGSGAATGNAVTDFSISDTSDGASTATATSTVDITATPDLSLVIEQSDGASLGGNYVSEITPSLESTGGQINNTPIVSVSLPVGEVWGSDPTATEWDCVVSNGTGTNSIATCTYTGSLPEAAGTSFGTITGTVDVSASAPTGEAATDFLYTDTNDGAQPISYSIDVNLTATPLLLISGSAPVAASVGGTYTQEITSQITPSGGPAYNQPVLVADLPAGESWGADPIVTGWSCGLSDGTGTNSVLTCTGAYAIPIVAGGYLGEIDATVDVSPAAATGDATTDLSITDVNDGASVASATTTVDLTPTPVLSVSGNAPAAASAGGNYVQALDPSLSGTGGQANNEPVLVADLPAGETWTTDPSATGWSCALSNGTGTNSVATCTSTLTLPILSSSSLAEIDGTVDVSGSAALGAAVTNYSLSDPVDGASQQTGQSSVDLTATPVLGVSGSGPAAASVGGSYTDDLSSSVSTGQANNEPVLVGSLPAGESWATDPSAVGWSCTLSDGSGADSIVTCTSTATLPVAVPTSLTDVDGTVDVSGSAATGDAVQDISLSDPNDGATQATATQTVDVTAAPVLSVSSSGPTASAQGGDYAIDLNGSVGSSGGQINSDPVETATLPTGETFASTPAAIDWSCVLSGGSGDNQTATCTYDGTVPVAAPSALQAIPATVDVSGSATLGPNVTDLSITDAGDGAGVGSGQSTVDISAAPTLDVSNSAPTGAAQGGRYTDQITSSVGSAAPAENDPVITAPLPSGFTWAADPSGAGWTCALSNGTGTDSVAICTSTESLPIAESTSLAAISGTVDVAGSAPLGNGVTDVSITDAHDGAAAASYDSTVDVTAAPQFTVSGPVPTGVTPGGSYLYSVDVSSSPSGGPAYVAPTVEIDLPPSEAFSAVPQSLQWSCVLSNASAEATCDYIGTLPFVAGTSADPIVATVDVSPSATEPGTLTTSVELTDPQDGVSPVGESYSLPVTADPEISVVENSPADASAGGSFIEQFSLGTGPGGGVAYNDPQITDTLGSGETWAEAPVGTGWNCVLLDSGSEAQCTSTSTTPIAVGTALPFVSGQVDVSTSSSGQIATTIVGTDPADGVSPYTDVVDNTITVTPDLGVGVTGPSTAPPGGSFDETINPTLGTSGGPVYSGPVVVATLPKGATWAPLTPQPGWQCSLSPDATELTCDYEDSLPVVPGTELPHITDTVEVDATASGDLTPTVVITAAASGDSATFNEGGPTDTYTGSPGYWLLGADGGVFAYGDAPFMGSLPSEHLQSSSPISSMAATPDGDGYWVVAQNGGVFAFGDARFYGSLAGRNIPALIVGIAATPDGGGYWLVGTNGEVFPFGDAGNYGMLGGDRINGIILSIRATPTGKGYWLVASDGGVFAFGDANFYGSLPSASTRPAAPVFALSPTPSGHGYWIEGLDGGVFSYGDANFYGNVFTANLTNSLDGPVNGLASTADGKGYWLSTSEGGVFAFGDAKFLGNSYTADIRNILADPIVGITAYPQG